MKVYLITCGEYSDYSVEYVTLDKDLAYKYVELQERVARYGSDYRVEEFDTSDFPILSLRDLENEAEHYVDAYEVRFDLRDNIIVDTEVVKCHVLKGDINKVIKKYYGRRVNIPVLADTKEKAARIALDIWFEKKAEEEGVT